MPFNLSTTLMDWRRHLHAHPELSRQEAGTAAFVCGRLVELGIPFSSEVGGHGVVATIARGPRQGSVGLRADMDALPIVEATDLPYASTRPGVMHACGHDGHTAALLGAARLLSDDPTWRGTVHLIFQPAEEGFRGAEAMMDDGLLWRFPLRSIFGFHNWPGIEAGVVMIHDGPVMAAASNVTIVVDGQPGHAAMPHLAADPIQGAAYVITMLNNIVARNIDPLDAAVVSICSLHAGQAMNQIPSSAVLGGTLRGVRSATVSALEERVAEVADRTAEALGLQVTVSFDTRMPATENTRKEARLAAASASAAGLKVRRDLKPSLAGEDFGCFLRKVPGTFAWIGNGSSAPLHSAAYDFNDAILPVAATYLAAVAKAALS